ncbi:hypothetical protein FJY71_07505, partial [candidate division WOR-3 bacterium]|nr:hypothetical protein [candidate division WOR-3 bacterium]
MRAAFNSKAWREWLAKVLAGHGVYYPAEAGGRVHWSRLRPDELSPDAPEPAWAFRSIRAAEPVKSFFFSPEERVATLPEKLVPGAQEKRVLLGLKACDVAALRVQEVMFGKGEFADPFYATRRREALLVAADCPVPAENCFCNLVGGKPYAEDGADIVMAQVDGQFVLEARSPEGEQLLAAGGRLWQPATEGMIAKRDEERLAAVKRLEQLNPAQWRPDLPQALNKRTTDRAFWAEHARACVECFGCLMTCPTCYCFLLYDSAWEQGMARTR